MNHQTGAVFIAFAAYTNEDGQQTYARCVFNRLLNRNKYYYHVDTRPMVCSFLPPERNTKRAPTISLTCGKTLILVGFYAVLRTKLSLSCYVENTEEADSKEALEFDEKEYPYLPGNVLELRLGRKKAIIRLFMAAARCVYFVEVTLSLVADHHDTGFYNLNGRIPWSDIAENPSNHLTKQS